METHTEQRYVLRTADCQSQYIIFRLYPIYLLSLLDLYSLLCYHYHLFATATKYPEWTCLCFVFVVQIQWDIWILYSMETHTEQR